MDTAAFRIVFALVFVAVAVTEAAMHVEFPRETRGYLALPRMGRSRTTYLTFPRAGRGYLALPRMGRSQTSESDYPASGSDASCCKTGLKEEWLMGEDGKVSSWKVCETGHFCCPNFEEVQNTKPDGSVYTMCVPKCGASGGDA